MLFSGVLFSCDFSKNGSLALLAGSHWSSISLLLIMFLFSVYLVIYGYRGFFFSFWSLKIYYYSMSKYCFSCDFNTILSSF